MTLHLRRYLRRRFAANVSVEAGRAVIVPARYVYDDPSRRRVLGNITGSDVDQRRAGKEIGGKSPPRGGRSNSRVNKISPSREECEKKEYTL